MTATIQTISKHITDFVFLPVTGSNANGFTETRLLY
jgi:hypothetical protein